MRPAWLLDITMPARGELERGIGDDYLSPTAKLPSWGIGWNCHQEVPAMRDCWICVAEAYCNSK